MKGGIDMATKTILKTVLKVSSLVLPMVLAYINNLQVKEIVEELVESKMK